MHPLPFLNKYIMNKLTTLSLSSAIRFSTCCCGGMCLSGGSAPTDLVILLKETTVIGMSLFCVIVFSSYQISKSEISCYC